ncbi:SDR family oxidoreductase [Agromyces aerolatus]|uniref:SDR family oxidoreductase n=1 Tax=Agromyces sp. LY-1074 TaxID=3074080 RepID=UPI0028571BC1|nr:MULTISPECIES: SDR family oxidoreductase [unclassified Agromyces]MDR5701833.1 SDR family oxidoreductase [Agromyces sp. LY-1074]MDR5708095.1 SDR family oxidoreductase [Agromyces sp. LY-1358]
MTASLLVTGGTGTIGRRTVPLLRDAGREVRVLSRHPRAATPGVEQVAGDTVSGAGLEAAFAGVTTVLHLAGGAKGDDVAARRVVAAASRARVSHLVLISVIGADAMPIGYFRAKAEAERVIAGSDVPWTILRVAQLHEFVLPVVRGMTRLPVLPVPGGLRFEPVHVDEVAARLAELALGTPAGRAADLAGPEVLDVRQLAERYAGAFGRARRPALPIRIPGAVGRAYRTGANLAHGPALRCQRTWADFAAGLAADAGAGASVPA